MVIFNPLYTNGFFLLVYNKLGIVHCTYLGVLGYNFPIYEGQSIIIEPYLITFESSKMDIYLDDISLQLYVIYLITYFVSLGRLFVRFVRQQNTACQRGAFML